MSNVRIQFDVKEEKLHDIERWMELSDISTRKLYVDYAFTIFQWALKQAHEGKVVAALDEKTGSYRELSMPPLDHVRKYSRTFSDTDV
jgi:hypothetical protein